MTGPNRFLEPPAPEEIRKLSETQYLDLNEEEIDYIEEYCRDMLDIVQRIDQLSIERRRDRFTNRDPGYQPDREEDPHNAFVRKCRVEGADEGILAGYEVGLKDNIAVRGIETTMGTTAMDSYVPTRDATVVRRLLNAGASITGKMTMTPFSMGDDLHVSGRNPHDLSRDAGASSTGSAIAVVTGDVDVALGADQGGSIRQPASWCGCVGLKPTRGLVPYTGIQSLDDTIDYVGPMASSVADCARTLEAIAGPSDGDPRQRADIEVDRYSEAIDTGLDGLTFGVLEEGFETENANEDVHDTVRAAIQEFDELGADVQQVSVPWHPDGAVLSTTIIAEGVAMKFRHEGLTPFSQGGHDVDFAESFGKARRVRGDDISIRIKANLVLGEHLTRRYQHRYYAKAQNLAVKLQAAYDDAFSTVDILLLPTWNDTAPELRAGESYREALESTFENWTIGGSSTTSQFNVSGHPALTIPCGTVDDLPVGLQLIGQHFGEYDLFRAADAFERHVDWKSNSQ